jgi:hypothetical protein
MEMLISYHSRIGEGRRIFPFNEKELPYIAESFYPQTLTEKRKVVKYVV